MYRGVIQIIPNALRSITKKQLNVPEKPKLKCLGFTYNGVKLFNMLPIKMKKMEDPNTFKTMTKDWISMGKHNFILIIIIYSLHVI